MRLTMLGTGHALVTRRYNTCFTLDGPQGCFLVDAGGGNGVLGALERAGIDWRRIGDLFVSHTHIDHLLGAVWVLRLFCHHMNEGTFDGSLTVHGNDEVIRTRRSGAGQLLRPRRRASSMTGWRSMWSRTAIAARSWGARRSSST